MSTQAARRCSAAGFGKIPTTSVRRLTSRLSRSSGLVDQILRQCASGKVANAVMSAPASRSIAATVGKLTFEHAGNGLDLLAHELAGGLGEDGADRGGDHL